MESDRAPAQEDDRLMALVARDQTEALNQLMLRWQDRIFHFIRKGVRDADVAEELAQETFWRVWQSRRKYEPSGTFSAWLFRIASRLCLDHYRKQSRRPDLIGSDDPPDGVAPARDDPAGAARANELAGAIDEAMAQLPVNQRLAMEMVRYEGLSYKEAAEALECSVGAVEQLLYRARQQLKVALAEYLPSDRARERAGDRAGDRAGEGAGKTGGPAVRGSGGGKAIRREA
jgi:RNA polymerase sigma-70 factor (ECF subfamily)